MDEQGWRMIYVWFQSLRGRLKTWNAGVREARQQEFQSLRGRLKTRLQRMEIPRNLVFQSLRGRLKTGGTAPHALPQSQCFNPSEVG